MRGGKEEGLILWSHKRAGALPLVNCLPLVFLMEPLPLFGGPGFLLLNLPCPDLVFFLKPTNLSQPLEDLFHVGWGLRPSLWSGHQHLGLEVSMLGYACQVASVMSDSLQSHGL